MATIYSVDTNELIEKAAEELKKNEHIKPPVWAGFVKTGAHSERSPVREDWWYVRTAAVLRTIYRQGPIGVAKLRVKYGGKKRRGHKPAKFYKGSGNILRKVLQQLEKAGYLKKEEKEQYRGRKITPAGKSFLDKISSEIYKVRPKPKVEVPKEAPKTVEKPKKEAVSKETVTEAPKAPKKEAVAEKPTETPKAEPKKEVPKVEEKPKEAPKVEKKEAPEAKKEATE